MKKGALLLIFFILLLAQGVLPTFAQEKQPVTIYFFWGKGCPHCAQEELFLQGLIKKYPGVGLETFEVTQNPENAKLLQKTGERLKTKIPGVPFTVIGEKYLIGYFDDQTTGGQIEQAVNCALQSGCTDVVGELTGPSSAKIQARSLPETLNLPLIGKLSIKKLSLPLLTVIIGFLDGFNPCALWVLLFLISLLLGKMDIKRRWALGLTFIFTSGLVYFLFLSAWLNFFLFVGFVFWVRIAIGLVALAVGWLNLREYFINRTGGCKVIEEKKRERLFEKLQRITQEKSFLLSLLGVITLAFGINLIELFCSMGLPVVFVQVLTIVHLPAWQYYLYLLLYCFFYILLALIIFSIAMVTLNAVGVQHKYIRLTRLISGIIIILIGLLLLFKPGWLMFG
jgi:thiol-disulfide isomerase/thioredoxin